MALAFDAVGANDFNRGITFSKGRISETVLKEIYADLDQDEVISIIFLMTDIYTDISVVLNSLKNDCKISFFDIPKIPNWAEKLLEALITIDNIKVLKKLAFSDNEIEAMKRQYFYDIHNVSENLNRVVKSLYFLCKEFTKLHVKTLVSKIYEDLQEPILQLTEEKMLLEIYILDWLQKKYISITVNPNLDRFINILKINVWIPCLNDFESWKHSNRKNQQDSSSTSRQSLQLENNKNSVNIIDSNVVPWKDKNHKRLCIIINQVEFKDKLKYPTRKGSDIDVKTINDTFKGLNFEINLEENITAPRMIEFLNSLSEDKDKYSKYAAIFLFILSHGQDGEVIFSDGKPVKVKKIQKKICCPNLQNVFKFVILQSCQGRKIGFVNNKLTTDSPVLQEGNGTVDEHLTSIYLKHFGLYQATVNEFISVRHETEGSWLIQDGCDELRKTTPIRLTEWVINVNKRVNDRKAETNYDDTYIVQVPCLRESTISEDYVFPKYNDNL